MTQVTKEESENPQKNHDDYVIIDDYAEENGLEDDENFGGFHNNQDVTSDADKAYMDAMDQLTDSGNNTTQSLMGEYWYQGIEEDDKDYTSPLMDLTSSYS